jgi:hypothetical protein
VLNFSGTSRSVDDARELGQQAVASGLNYPSSMSGDCRINKCLPERLELGQRAFFVGTHQTAIPGDVRRQNGC